MSKEHRNDASPRPPLKEPKVPYVANAPILLSGGLLREMQVRNVALLLMHYSYVKKVYVL